MTLETLDVKEPRASALIGRSVGNYRLVRLLGEGGMGAVFLAENPVIESQVAIKVLHQRHAGDAVAVRRLLDEARAVNRVKHPGIVRIHDCGQARGLGVYLVMELLDGRTLREELAKRGRLPVGEVAHVLIQAASVLDAVHQTKIIHRDLKPENMFQVDDPTLPGATQIKILDFGFAKLLDAAVTLGAATKTGLVFGSPMYMSPEQCCDSKMVDHRTDIYALGAIAYELVTGRVPFKADTLGELVKRHLTETPRPPAELNPEVPDRFQQVILKAMAREMEQRHQSVKELAEALAPFEEEPLASEPEPGRASEPETPATSQDKTLPPPIRGGTSRETVDPFALGEEPTQPHEGDAHLPADPEPTAEPAQTDTVPDLPAEAARPPVESVPPDAGQEAARRARPVALYAAVGLAVLAGFVATLVLRTKRNTPAPSAPAEKAPSQKTVVVRQRDAAPLAPRVVSTEPDRGTVSPDAAATPRPVTRRRRTRRRRPSRRRRPGKASGGPEPIPPKRAPRPKRAPTQKTTPEEDLRFRRLPPGVPKSVEKR